MDKLEIRQGGQTPACNVDAGYAAADDGEEDKPVDDVCEPIDLGPSNSNDKRTSKRTSSINQILVVVRYAHAYQPDVDHKEREHAPQDWFDSSLDRPSRLFRLARDDGNVLPYQVVLACADCDFKRSIPTTTKAESSLDESLCNTSDTIVESPRCLPVSKLDRPICRFDASRCHNEQEEDHDNDGKTLDERHDVFNLAVVLHGKHVSEDEDGEEYSDVSRERNHVSLRPELEHRNRRCDLRRYDHCPLLYVSTWGLMEMTSC